MDAPQDPADDSSDAKCPADVPRPPPCVAGQAQATGCSRGSAAPSGLGEAMRRPTRKGQNVSRNQTLSIDPPADPRHTTYTGIRREPRMNTEPKATRTHWHRKEAARTRRAEALKNLRET